MINILGPIVNGVTSYFKGNQEIKAAKLAGEIAVITAETNAKLAISEAKISMARSGQANDFDLDRIAVQDMKTSYKDEFILILFSVPIIMAFTPWAATAQEGFAIIDTMPDWFKYTYVGMIVVIYGMRGMLTKVLDKKLPIGK